MNLRVLMLACLLWPATLGACGQKSPHYNPAMYIIEMKTSLGTMVFELSNLTPKHRDNFVKLTQEGYYNGLAFHRVISNFMIQGGDPDTRNFQPGRQYGTGGPDYTIPAEIVPELFHQKGALAAARQGDQVNPEKRSSGSQFYIVQGEVLDSSMLEQYAQQMVHQAKMRVANQAVQDYFAAHEAELRAMPTEQAQEKLNEIGTQAYQKAPGSAFTPAQRKVYSTVGGTPHLDHEYTVFGQLIEGFDVLDKIAAVEKDQADCPKKKVEIISCKVIQTPKDIKK